MGKCSEIVSAELKAAIRKGSVGMDDTASRRLGSVCNLVDKVAGGLSDSSIKATLGASNRKLVISVTCPEIAVFLDKDDGYRASFFALMNLLDSFRVDGSKGYVTLNFIINDVWGG